MAASARIGARERDAASSQSVAPERLTSLLAAGGAVAALGASSCCVLPLLLFMLGVSGAWIGNLTRLTPYQPYILAVTVALLA